MNSTEAGIEVTSGGPSVHHGVELSSEGHSGYSATMKRVLRSMGSHFGVQRFLLIVVFFALSVKTATGQTGASAGSQAKTSEALSEGLPPARKALSGSVGVTPTTGGAAPTFAGTSSTIVGLSSALDEKYFWLTYAFNFSKKKRSAFMQMVGRRNRGGLKTLLPDEWRSILADVERDFGSKVSSAVVRLEKSDMFQPIIDELAVASLKTGKPLDSQQALMLLDEMFDMTIRASGELDPQILDAESLAKSSAAFLYLTKQQNDALVTAVGHWKASLAQK